MHCKKFVSLALIVSSLTGCAIPQASPNVYRLGETMQAGTAQPVTVLRVRPVTISSEGESFASQSGVPAMVGAGIAALLAYGSIGNGKGRYAAAALATPIGAIGTQQVSQWMSRRGGVEIIVRTDTGRNVVVTQDADQAFTAGDRVYLVSSSRGYRVTR